MKKYIILFPLIIAGCISTPETPLDPSLKIEIKEFDKDQDGVNEIKLIRTFRDGKEVKAEVINSKNPANSFRAFYVNGEYVMKETDEDSDGFFETLILYDTKTDNIEVFKRSKDGQLTPATRTEVSSKKKILKGIKEYFDKRLEEERKKLYSN